jgi:RNA-directed DNA polymerase
VRQAKPYWISKQEVWKAYQKVKANKGAAGVDEQSIAEFEKRLKDNLYRIWNRMSSGSYFPPPVRRVTIPKDGGGERTLGIPTVSDRIAQTVVKSRLEPVLDPLFDADSYAYRPGKSALQAVGQARKRCWRYDWVVDLDIKGFFDNIDHDLMMRAVKKHAREKWIVVYVERWLKAPMQSEDGQRIERGKGTPQGGVISPLLANLFLHYAFDRWVRRSCPHLAFERFADDVIVHCRTKAEAEAGRAAIAQRLRECGLELHPEKTRVVYCKDEDRRGNYLYEKFDFLGYTFRPRRSKSRKGKYFINFSPAISDKAAKAIRVEIRSWKLHARSDKAIDDLARMFNPIVRGWLQYYGCYYRSAMYPVIRHLDRLLARWACRKYKKLRHHLRRASHWIRSISVRDPRLFAHWQLGVRRSGSTMGAV